MIAKFWSSKKNKIIVFFVLMFLSLIPVVYTWGRLPIGGDVFIYINSDGLKKYLYQWITVENGQYFVLNFFPFYLFYKIFELFKLSLYQISSLLLFSLSFIAGMGIYKLVKLFFEKEHFSLYVLPIVFYLLSPALLNGWVYGYVYSFAPWFIYFVFKAIKFKRLKIEDLIFMSFLFSILSADLPNPKYIFHLGIISLIIVTSALFLRLVDFKFITNNLVKLILFFLLSAYLFLPLFYFAANYSAEGYGVHVKTGYVDTGQMMDYGSATVVKMVRLHQDNMNIETSHKIEYNSNLVVGVLSYLPIVLIIIGLLIIKNRYYLIFTLLSVCFLFFAVGPNKPFGFVYEFFVSNFKYLAFLRTTAGAVFFLSIFYSVLLAFILNHLARKSKIIFPLILLSILIVGYPFLNGDYYKNRKIVNPYTDDKQYGQRIPQDYFDVKKDIDAVKRDIRIVYSVPNLTYINTTWGFFGFPIYNFIYNSNNIGFKTVFSNLADHNVGLIYLDKSLIDSPGIEAIASEEQSILVKKTDLIELRKVKDDYFLPHFYIPKNIIYSNGGMEILPKIVSFRNYELRSGIYLENLKIRNLEILNKVNDIFVKGELVGTISREVLEGVTVETVSPFIKYQPGEWTYWFILKKEEFDKWKIRKNPEKIFEKNLLYASKRITELATFDIKDAGQLKSLMDNYKREMESAMGETKEVDKLKAYLGAHRKKIDQTNLDKDIKDKIRNVFNDLENKIAELKPKQDFSKLVYKVEIPKTGEYQIFIKDINGLTTNLLTNYKENDGDWITLGENYFKEGEQELILPFSGISENLVDENLRIKDYSPNSIYRISFDYQAPRGGSFFVAEGKTGKTTETQLSPTGDEFRHFEMFFKSSPDVQEAAVHLSISVSEERNLKIERIYQPEIVLKSDTRDVIRDTKQIPRITFIKINPMKYRVKVEGATDPYTLIFSESFHQGWKAYINQYQISNIKYQKDYGEIVASYFDGEIKEGTHKNIFLDRNTFETWRKKPISEEKHSLVNGYANSWYIAPEDAGGKQDYELIIEFAPQRLFYKGLFISGITLAGCLIYLLYNSIIVRRNRQ